MDLQMFFKKKREIESSIATPFAVVMSLDTPDGGRGGRVTEVNRGRAAQLVLEGRARLATEEESRGYHEEGTVARENAAQSAISRMPLAVLSEQEMRTLRTSLRRQKE